MICADCFALETKSETATIRVFLVGYSRSVPLCDKHAYERDDAGQVGKAVRLTGSVK